MTEVINIPDRERAKDALILQMSQGRDVLAARVEALEAALANLLDGLDRTSWSSWQSTEKFSEQMKVARRLILENQT